LVLGSFFFAVTRQTHSQGFGFSRLACRERSERNAKREKTYIIFAGGTDAKIIKSISEGNTACSLFAGGTDANNQIIHFRRKYRLFFIY